jgi:carbohydrate kinase (thermoresistant glucokinase family)
LNAALENPVPVIVMGVSGAGKSTIGAALAEQLGVVFLDGDDLHPESNILKMAAGTSLTDEDRAPWLDRVGQELGHAHAAGRGMVIACSALKYEYRERIRRGAPSSFFVELDGTREELLNRMTSREGHFMPASLLDSQLALLEPLTEEENGIRFSCTTPISVLVRETTQALAGRI